jgi:hypothetical protein
MVRQENFKFLTQDESVVDLPVYKTISSVLMQMIRSGVVNMGAGYCISMSDMLRTALQHRGVKSRLVECQLTVTYRSQDPPDVRFIGFDDIVNPGEIDTHVVVITETDPPFLIDASIPHRLPPNTYAVVEPVIAGNHSREILDETYTDHGITVSYRQKPRPHVSIHHQESILERIETDRRIFKNLGWLKTLIIVALTISTLNALRGAYDFYQVYVSENYWGPRTLQQIDERLDTLEDLLIVPPDQRRQYLEKQKSQQ